MIGIYTRYRHSDATHAALAVARQLDDMGRTSTLMRYDWRVTSVDPAYDNRVKVLTVRRNDKHIHHGVWTSPSTDQYFLDLHDQHRVKNTLFISWEQLEPYDERILDDYNHVLVPTVNQAVKLRARFGLKNLAVLPFYCGYPITRRREFVEPGKIHLFMSLYGSQLKRVDLSALLMTAEVVRDNPNVFMTVACSTGLAPYTVRELNNISRTLENRWRVIYKAPWHEHALLMGQADLTIWPARWDGLGLIGLTSLHMGTPVISWDVTPMNEHLSAGRNAILVKSDFEYDWLGVPTVIPNYDEFARNLRWLIRTPEMLTELRARTHEQLDEWDTEFVKGLNTILPE